MAPSCRLHGGIGASRERLSEYREADHGTPSVGRFHRRLRRNWNRARSEKYAGASVSTSVRREQEALVELREPSSPNKAMCFAGLENPETGNVSHRAKLYANNPDK